MKFVIKKEVDASSIKEALKKEPTSEVVEIYRKEDNEPAQTGFQA